MFWLSRWSLTLAVTCVLTVLVMACAPQPATPPKESAPQPTTAAAPKTEAQPATGAKAEAKPASTAAPATKPAPSDKPAAKQLPKLRVAWVAPVGSFAAVWMAQESGAFQQEGVEVDLQFIQANSAIAALFAGDVDLLEISAPPVVSAGLQEPNLVMIAGTFNTMIHSLHARPGLKTAEDLRGKLIGTDRLGTPTRFATQVVLNKLGLKESDVQLLEIGSSNQILAALVSGQLDAATQAPPQNFQAEKAGYPMILDTYDVQYQNVGIVALRSRLPALEPAIIPFLKAHRTGIDRYQDKEFALKVLAKYTQEPPDSVEQTYEFFRQRGFNKKLDVTVEGIKTIIDYTAQTNPAARSAKPEQFYDMRYVEQLPKL